MLPLEPGIINDPTRLNPCDLLHGVDGEGVIATCCILMEIVIFTTVTAHDIYMMTSTM